MGKYAGSKGRGTAPAPSGAGAETAPPTDNGAHDGDIPLMALASSEPPKAEASKIDLATVESQKNELPKIENQRVASAASEAANSEAAALAPPKPEVPSLDGLCPPTADSVLSSRDRQAIPYGSARTHRFPLLAASLVLAAALGAMVGGLVATALANRIGRATPPTIVSAKSSVEEMQALKEQVVQVRVDLAALKSSIDSGHRNANAQLTKIGERVERLDRTQAEPVAKLTKAIEAFERRETTGSVTPSQPIPAQPSRQPGVVEGWVLRDVQRGTAVIEGRLGIIEVDPGDVVPGLGRVEAVRKQDGRWVVVTSKGLILPPR